MDPTVVQCARLDPHLGNRRKRQGPHGHPVCRAGIRIRGRKGGRLTLAASGVSGWSRIWERRNGRRTPRSSSVAGRIRMNGERGEERTRCPRSSRVGYRIRIQAKEVVERSGGEMMVNVPTWHGRSWSMRLWLASTEVIIPEVSDPSWDPSSAESAPFSQRPLLDVLQV